jgi:hypothetical protein
MTKENKVLKDIIKIHEAKLKRHYKSFKIVEKVLLIKNKTIEDARESLFILKKLVSFKIKHPNNKKVSAILVECLKRLEGLGVKK